MTSKKKTEPIPYNSVGPKATTSIALFVLLIRPLSPKYIPGNYVKIIEPSFCIAFAHPDLRK